MNLITKTWINDLPWIELSVHSVLKHCTEPVTWNLTIERQNRQQLNDVLGKVRANFNRQGDLFKIFDSESVWPDCKLIPDGYMRQQWIKMNMHKVIGENIAWNWDSDVIAINPFSAESFMRDGRPIQWWDEMNNLIIGGYPQERKTVMMDLYNNFSCKEFMRCMPIPLHGKCLKAASETPVWKRSFDFCASGMRAFSEFNVIGEYCFQNYPDLFTWLEPGKEPNGTWQGESNDKSKIVSQQWSWGGINDEVKKLVYG